MRAVAGGILCLFLGACGGGTNASDDAGPCELAGDSDGDGERSFACGGRDCDDDDPLRSPGNTETCDAAGLDEDCDPATLGPDVDRDGAAPLSCCNRQPDGELLCGTDCADELANVGPHVPEVCDGRDNDCSGTLDYPGEDDDGDGWADCIDLPAALRDCDDARDTVHPGHEELCNDIDDNCDEQIDEGWNCTWTTPICAADGRSCAPCVDEGSCPSDMRMCLDHGPLAGACGQCNPADGLDNCSSDRPYCDPTTLRCEACVDDGHCPDSGFRCRDHQCVCEVENECTCDIGVAECTVGQTCVPFGPSAYPECV